MKNFTTVILPLVVIICCSTFSNAADLKDGFMRYHWGENISQFAGLTKLYTKQDVTYYSNPGETYTMDDNTINDVILGFYKDTFFAAYIGIDTLELYDKINLHLKTKYGIPGTKVSSKDYVTTHKWKYQDITIKLKTNEIKRKMKLAFYYTPLSRDLNAVELDQFGETSFRFFPIDKNKKPERIPFLEF